jgi:hypothetical protein
MKVVGRQRRAKRWIKGLTERTRDNQYNRIKNREGKGAKET